VELATEQHAKDNIADIREIEIVTDVVAIDSQIDRCLMARRDTCLH